MLRNRPSPLRPVLAAGACAVGNLIMVIVGSGQLPDNPDLFDYTGAASAVALALALVALGVWQFTEYGIRLDAAARASLKRAYDREMEDVRSSLVKLHDEDRDHLKQMLSLERENTEYWMRFAKRAEQVASSATALVAEVSAELAAEEDARISDLEGQLAEVSEGIANADRSNVVSLYRD